MSIRPPRPDVHRRCFAPCLPGSFCLCLGKVIGREAGANDFMDEVAELDVRARAEMDSRGFTEWEHEPDEFDRDAEAGMKRS